MTQEKLMKALVSKLQEQSYGSNKLSKKRYRSFRNWFIRKMVKKAGMSKQQAEIEYDTFKKAFKIEICHL